MASSPPPALPSLQHQGQMSGLAQKLIDLHGALDSAGVAHAFGGALALAYCTHEPRGTRDIDVNVFVAAEHADDVLRAMPDGVAVLRASRAAARREGQVRVMWQDTPIDLFFETHDFHKEVARSIRSVPFEGITIPVLDCISLIVFKAMFNRTRDWADIEAILEAGDEAGRSALERVRQLLGAGDPATIRLAALIH